MPIVKHIGSSCIKKFAPFVAINFKTIKMKLKLIILSLIASFCVSINYNAVAQDYKFSQVFSNPLLINPAYAGSLGHSRVSVSYRNQWEGEDVTFSAAYDQHIPKLSGGVGLQYISENYLNGYITILR
jgi:hypothetical protein